jgi:hypothetical protein
MTAAHGQVESLVMEILRPTTGPSPSLFQKGELTAVPGQAESNDARDFAPYRTVRRGARAREGAAAGGLSAC